jgi:hypothetical protein
MRRAGGSRDLTLVVGAAVLMLLVAGLTSVVSPPGEGLGVRGSSLSTGTAGAKAGFLLLRRLGYDVRRTFDAVADLELDPATDVLVLMAGQAPPSDLDVRALERFVEAGGVAVVGESRAWLPAYDADAAVPSTATTPEAVLPSPLAVGATRIRMDHLGGAGTPRPPYVTTHADARGTAVAAARIGRGRVVYWASALPATNIAIDEPGHVELLLNAVGAPRGRRVLWDEHYHGHRRSAWSYASGTPLPAALAQLGLIGLAAVATVSLRRWPLRARPEPPRTAPLEFVDTMGGLYQRANATTTAVGVALAHLRRRLTAAAGLPADADDARLARAAARAGLAPEALASLLARAREAQRGPLAAGAAVEIVRVLQDAARFIERGTAGPATSR